jgi:hypothetical protein
VPDVAKSPTDVPESCYQRVDKLIKHQYSRFSCKAYCAGVEASFLGVGTDTTSSSESDSQTRPGYDSRVTADLIAVFIFLFLRQVHIGDQQAMNLLRVVARGTLSPALALAFFTPEIMLKLRHVLKMLLKMAAMMTS